MKIGVWLLLATLLLAGCAPGYYAPRQSGYQEEGSTKLYGNPYTNPETPEEQSNRIWWEESHP